MKTIRFAILPLLAVTAGFGPASASASFITPATIIKCEGPDLHDGEAPLSFKMVIYENDYDGENPGQKIHTTFKAKWDGDKIKAKGLTSRTGYTPRHKAIFETTFPNEAGDMRYITIRFASGSVPGSALEQAVLIAPPRGGMPANIPLTCAQSYSFRLGFVGQWI